jgi:hypothetical protein
LISKFTVGRQYLSNASGLECFNGILLLCRLPRVRIALLSAAISFWGANGSPSWTGPTRILRSLKKRWPRWAFSRNIFSGTLFSYLLVSQKFDSFLLKFRWVLRIGRPVQAMQESGRCMAQCQVLSKNCNGLVEAVCSELREASFLGSCIVTSEGFGLESGYTTSLDSRKANHS